MYIVLLKITTFSHSDATLYIYVCRPCTVESKCTEMLNFWLHYLMTTVLLADFWFGLDWFGFQGGIHSKTDFHNHKQAPYAIRETFPLVEKSVLHLIGLATTHYLISIHLNNKLS